MIKVACKRATAKWEAPTQEDAFNHLYKNVKALSSLVKWVKTFKDGFFSVESDIIPSGNYNKADLVDIAKKKENDFLSEITIGMIDDEISLKKAEKSGVEARFKATPFYMKESVAYLDRYIDILTSSIQELRTLKRRIKRL